MINLDQFTFGYQAIDKCHLYLIQGLLASFKPKRILELGVGTGNVSQVVLQVNKFNQNDSELICVDNWQDWQGELPKIAVELKKLGATIITQTENKYVNQNKDERFDFIISDGAHGRSDQWCDKLYDMLNPNGVLIAHDVTNKDFPNLQKYKLEADARKYNSFVVNKSTRKDERCHRGLLVVCKG